MEVRGGDPAGAGRDRRQLRQLTETHGTETMMTENGTVPGVVERHEGIITVRGGGRHRAWNGIEYKTGMWAENVGSGALSMNVAMIPPGGVAKAHIHVDFEVMLYILEGRVRHEFGPRLEKTLDNEAGDFIFIEPGVPHEVFNLSDTEPVVAVVARSDAQEWENIVDFQRPARD
ncbi:MAG: cupin domain-containing protein [Gemmatimonadales bacterium]|nr:cupin domain-containing protein [Gemmatimonadales bacterium]MYG18596.1 cupin domain-containing protein [Gemmatimonadales bacterium]